MKTFAFVSSIIAVTTEATLMQKIDFDFMRFITENNRTYKTVLEFELRKSLYAEIDDFINETNAKGGLYRAGHNEFSDYLPEEK